MHFPGRKPAEEEAPEACAFLRCLVSRNCPHDAGVVEVLPSLLDFRPAAFGLPEFEDQVGGAVVLHPPWRIKGTVVKGFGRGSKARARIDQND